VLAEVPFEILRCPVGREPTGVDVGVVSLLEALLAGDEVLSLEVRAAQNL